MAEGCVVGAAVRAVGEAVSAGFVGATEGRALGVPVGEREGSTVGIDEGERVRGPTVGAQAKGTGVGSSPCFLLLASRCFIFSLLAVGGSTG